MNRLEKILNEKLTENGDKSYKSTGNNLTDLFFMTPYFEKHLDEVSIGTSEKEKVKEDKAKVHTSTANVYDAYKTATRGVSSEAKDVIANKIVDNATLDVEMNAICIVDSSGSMGWNGSGDSLLARAYSIAYAIATKSSNFF